MGMKSTIYSTFFQHNGYYENSHAEFKQYCNHFFSRKEVEQLNEIPIRLEILYICADIMDQLNGTNDPILGSRDCNLTLIVNNVDEEADSLVNMPCTDRSVGSSLFIRGPHFAAIQLALRNL